MTKKDEEKDYYTDENNKFHSLKPIHIDVEELTDDQKDKIFNSKTFCMIPWIHLHAFPDGRAYPCCLSNNNFPIGNLRENTMKEVWNDKSYRKMRLNMLEDKPCRECTRCYEQEKNSFFSMRNEVNKSFGHHINLIDETKEDGTVEDFKLRYYDIRFSNLCNFKCRSCGSWFSSSWHKEETDLFGKKGNPQMMYAGKDKDDMWNQMQEHIPYLEKIYFAGGEPLIMEEHYQLIKELVKRKQFDVKLTYNTNFSKLMLKDEDVLDLWTQFDSVSIGASLDAMGTRAEYMRKGTEWNVIEDNRRRMQEKCPDVDFYVNCTVSLFNVLHVCDFHREWVEQGFLSPQDWNINMLQEPLWYRADLLPKEYKEKVKERIIEHLEWLTPLDYLERAVIGYKGILNYLENTPDNVTLEKFFEITDMHDGYRNEKFEDVFPEYKDLRKYV